MTIKSQDEDRAIIELRTVSDDLLVFEIRDRIGADDVAFMANRVERSFEDFERIDLMLIMTNFDGVDPAGILQGDALGVALQSLQKVRRYCVVGAPTWARTMIEFFKWVTPVEEKTFAMSELDDAWRWVERRNQA